MQALTDRKLDTINKAHYERLRNTMANCFVTLEDGFFNHLTQYQQKFGAFL